MTTQPRVYFFGCWKGEAGHHLNHPKGSTIPTEIRTSVSFYGATHPRRHIDGTLAPRRHTSSKRIIWTGMDSKEEYRSEECEQGLFLVHHLDNGFTAMAWWDRTQGDTRPGSNSVVLIEGKHDADDCIAALIENFPDVLRNLTKAGVKLVPAKTTPDGQ